MNFFVSPLIDTIVLITAIINLICVILLFFTCRFIPGLNLTNPLMRMNWYKPVYKYHSYIWWLLAPSVLIHAVITIIHRLLGG
jgi:hypothetical protein